MTRLKFEGHKEPKGGVTTIFTDGKGTDTSTWWSSPPNSIDHVDLMYLQGRHPNARNERHEEFIKKEFKNLIKTLKEDGEFQ